MEYRKRSWFCSLLAALCLLSALPPMESLARTAVDTGRKCTLSVSMPLNRPAEDWEDLKEAETTVDICRVAGMNAAGEYRKVNGFEALYGTLKELEENPEKAGAAFWKEQAEAAAETFHALTAEKEEGGAGLPDTYTIRLQDGEGFKEDLPVGLYLVCPRDVETGLCAYTFEPYLISLPNSYYGTETGDGETNRDDTWVYEVETVLKPERTFCRGDVLIEKTLERHNASLGPAVFVFQVDAVKDLDGDGIKENVYSNVISISFDAAGTKSTLVEGLPAGAEVTVTEVYAGSAYEPAGASGSKTVTVRGNGEEAEETAGEDTAETGEEDKVTTNDINGNEENGPVKVTFTNRYNNVLTPGTGVTNRFTGEEETEGENGLTGWTWKWEKISHSRQEDTEKKEGDGNGQDQP